MPPCEDRLRAGVVQLGEKKAPGKPESGLSVSKRAVRKKGGAPLVESVVIGQGEAVSN